MRGENIYPSEIDAAVNALAGHGGEHRIIITREAAMDELIVQVEAARSVAAAGEAALERFRAEVASELQRVLGIRVMIEIVEEQSILRTDFKARRVIDDRAVFRDFAQKLGVKG